MDENEITTVADTQAEKTADTADTGQTTPTTEELIQQLTARVAALEEIVGEEEYELRYSGEQTDELLDGGTAVFRAKTAAQIVSLVNRLYPLYMRWGSFTVNMKVNADNGSQWTYNTRTGMIPSGVTNPAVFMVCDWGKKHFKSQSFQYKVASNSRDIDWEAYLEHTSDQGGTYAFKVYYLIVGKNAEGGKYSWLVSRKISDLKSPTGRTGSASRTSTAIWILSTLYPIWRADRALWECQWEKRTEI